MISCKLVLVCDGCGAEVRQDTTAINDGKPRNRGLYVHETDRALRLRARWLGWHVATSCDADASEGHDRCPKCLESGNLGFGAAFKDRVSNAIDGDVVKTLGGTEMLRCVCGGQGIFRRDNEDAYNDVAVECSECKKLGPWMPDMQNAVEAWNNEVKS